MSAFSLISGKHHLLSPDELRDFLDDNVLKYNTPDFIQLDPIQIPHRFTEKEDIEISGFLTAVIAWGSRKSILRSAEKMMQIMGNAPYEFIMEHHDSHLDKLEGFVHRTFNAQDVKTFIRSLRNLYALHSGLEGAFAACYSGSAVEDSLQPAIHRFKRLFFTSDQPVHAHKHLPDPLSGSAAKRINMFLRWMVRNDHAGVDFGLWKSLSPAILSCPLDIHTGNISRQLGLLTRKSNDARAVRELDLVLRGFDPTDPVKYDFALFGLGVYGDFADYRKG